MNTKYPLLNLMLNDMSKQDQLYRPTTFWEYGSSLIIKALDKFGIENFRTSESTRHFFVPGYTVVEYLEDPAKYDKLIEEFRKIVTDQRFVTRVERLFTGYTGAINDYRVLLASNINKKPFTDTISESQIGNPLEQIQFDGRYFSKSMLNYLLGLNFLKQTVDTKNIKTVMEIGGGFGTLGEILLGDERNEAFYINADIPPIGFVSSYYLQNLFGKEQIADYEVLKDFESLDIETLKKHYKGLNICSWQVPQLKGKIDLFVNFISFQEMEPEIVQNYCLYVDKLEPKYILLRNMQEGKRKQSETFKAGVIEPILGDDYNKFLPNYQLIAKDSAVYGFITEDGFHSELRIYERI
jgi:putative sugar O-methyltransferase